MESWNALWTFGSNRVRVHAPVQHYEYILGLGNLEFKLYLWNALESGFGARVPTIQAYFLF